MTSIDLNYKLCWAKKHKKENEDSRTRLMQQLINETNGKLQTDCYAKKTLLLGTTCQLLHDQNHVRRCGTKMHKDIFVRNYDGALGRMRENGKDDVDEEANDKREENTYFSRATTFAPLYI